MSLGETYYDSDIYDNAGQGGKSRYDGYVTSIAANDEVEDDDVENVPITQKRSGYTAPASLLNDIAQVHFYKYLFYKSSTSKSHYSESFIYVGPPVLICHKYKD